VVPHGQGVWGCSAPALATGDGGSGGSISIISTIIVIINIIIICLFTGWTETQSRANSRCDKEQGQEEVAEANAVAVRNLTVYNQNEVVNTMGTIIANSGSSPSVVPAPVN